MSMFDDIKAGLEDAIAYAEGDASKGVAHRLVDVASVRTRMGLTQKKLARVLGVNINTIRSWEQHVRTPRGPARSLLLLLEANPEFVVTTLKDALLGGEV